MDDTRIEHPVLDFVPETCGRLMDFVRDSDVSYDHLKKQAEEQRRAFRWSGAGKNMTLLGSFEPSRFDDTFVGNFRRAGVYKKPPTRTTPAYEYWLDEQGRLTTALRYNTEEDWIERLGPYYYETFLAHADDTLRVFVCWQSGSEGKKTMDYVFGYRYEGQTLAEKAELHYIGKAMTGMNCQLYTYGADRTLLSAEDYHMTGPELYQSPMAKALGYPNGLPYSLLSYRGDTYLVAHGFTPKPGL